MSQLQVGCVEITLGCEQLYLKRAALQFGSEPFGRCDEMIKEGGWLHAATYWSVGITEPEKLSMMDVPWYGCRMSQHSIACLALVGPGLALVGPGLTPPYLD
jgi:hypothetical protein